MGTCACAEVDGGGIHSDADMASDVAKCNVTEHNISVNELAVRLRTSPELGLTNEQAAFRLKEDGQNIAPNTIGCAPSNHPRASHNSWQASTLDGRIRKLW